MWFCVLSELILVKTRLNMAAILKFKMAAEDTLKKNGSNSAFVHWSIKKVKSIGSTSIANFALDYITPCTITEKVHSGNGPVSLVLNFFTPGL